MAEIDAFKLSELKKSQKEIIAATPLQQLLLKKTQLLIR